MSDWRVICGDVLATLRAQPDASFDGCLCDPPYGLRFMGARWDYDVPSIETWREVLRVLKPGAPLLAFGGTRTWHRVAVAIEDGGFDIEDSLAWIFGQGKPATRHRLKPAHEPVVLARRPFPGTIALNLATWGVGSLAIDTCRIESRRAVQKGAGARGYRSRDDGYVMGTGREYQTDGRWPANVILDDDAARILDGQTGLTKSHGHKKRPSSEGWATRAEHAARCTILLPPTKAAPLGSSTARR